jgi:spore maturation protein CgeB
MSRRFRIAYFAHAIRSDWNNGNAHFLRGLRRGLGECGHLVEAFEPEDGWSIENLCQEENGKASLQQFAEIYPELRVSTYDPRKLSEQRVWSKLLRGVDVVIQHEWNPPELAHLFL